MKLLLPISILIIVLSIWYVVEHHEQPKRNYYVVGKEKIDGHMCCSESKPRVISAATPICRPVVVAHHTHKWEPSRYYIAIARPYQCLKVEVDSLSWNTIQIHDTYRY